MLLNTLENINSALAVVKNNPDVRPEKFYSKILLDTIKLPMEDYVHLKHATKSYTMDGAHEKLVLKRFGSWTPHTEVLKEGIPPRPDLTRSESIELGYTQFGRFAYFTDQIRTDVVDDFVAHYTKELSDLANRTLEKFAREKLLSAPSVYFANAKTGYADLVPGDLIGVADLRLMVLKFSRMMINTIDGFYNYICSPEFLYDMIEDEYIKDYMELNQSTFNLYTSGQPFPLFKVKYIETRLDENLAPDLDHPGEYVDSSDVYWLRMISNDGKYVYSLKNGASAGLTVDNEVDVTDTSNIANRAVLKEYYYRDGSAIENRVYWKINSTVLATRLNVQGVYENVDGVYTDITSTAEGEDAAMQAKLTSTVILDSVELPVNKGILTGSNGLAKVTVGGQGAAEIIVKPLGSGGTNDPLNQLSSVGFKIRGVGFGFERPEAIYVTISVPNHALDTVGITRDAILGNQGNAVLPGGMITDDSGTDKYVVDAWVTSTAYIVGDRVSSGGNFYICSVAHTSGTFATDLAAEKWIKYGTVAVDNPGDLGLAK